MTNKVSQIVPYQYNTAYSPFSASEFEYALDWIAGQGFTGVEVAIAYPQKVNAAKLLKSVCSRSLQITTISTGQLYGLDRLYLASPDHKVRDRAVAIVKGHIDLSTMIGLPPVTIGLLRGAVKTGEESEQLCNFQIAMEECITYAFHKKVCLQIEPLNARESLLLNTVAETLDFIDMMGNPENLGILYDTYHAHFEKEEPFRMIREAGQKLFSVHYADTNRMLPGFGGIDFTTIHKEILATGYKGAFALKVITKPSREYILEHCKNSIFGIVNVTEEL